MVVTETLLHILNTAYDDGGNIIHWTGFENIQHWSQLLFSKHVLAVRTSRIGIWQGPESQCAALDKLLSVSNYRCSGYLLHNITHWKEHNNTTLKVHRPAHCRGVRAPTKSTRIRQDKNIFANITLCSHTNEKWPPSTKPLFNSSTLSPSRKLPDKSEKAMRLESKTYLRRERGRGELRTYHRAV